MHALSLETPDRAVQPAFSDAVENAVVLGLAVIATAFPVFAHLGGQALGLVSCVVIGALLATFAVPIVPAALIFAYLFQNLFVSLVSPWLEIEEFNAIRAYNFVLTGTAWLVLVAHYLFHSRCFDARTRSVILLCFGILTLVFFYCLVGMGSDPKAAAVYLRNIASPFLLLQVCLIVGARYGMSAARAFVMLGWLIVAYGYAELLFRDTLFGLINSDSYLALRLREANDAGQWIKLMQETGWVVRDFEDTQKVNLLNTPLLDIKLEVYRLMGPNFHAISFAYALCFMCVASLARGRILYCLAALPLLVVIGSKGALITLLLSGLFLGLSRLAPFKALFWILAGVLAVYGVAGVVIGREIGDYHVIGLLGGVEGFLKNPVGRGLGVGGNLSVNMAAMDWSRSQALGQTDTAVESAVGVLLFQMGVAGLAVCAAICGSRAKLGASSSTADAPRRRLRPSACWPSP